MFSRSHLNRFFVLLFFIGWFLYFSFLWWNMIAFDGQDLRVGGINVWGDWAMHFTQGSSFAYRSLWLTHHPLLYGATFSYPFLVNWISGVFIRYGMEFFSAFVLPSYVYSLIFVVALFFLYKIVFRSRGIAILSSMIFLLNGGLGFLWYFRDVVNNPNMQTFFGFTKEYTHLSQYGIEWISVITSMIVPQRSFTFGFPIALLVFIGIYRQIQKKRKMWNSRIFFVMGVLAGFMPLIHMHSFMMMAIVLLWWMTWSVMRKEDDESRVHALFCWALFGVATLFIASPVIVVWYIPTVNKTVQGSFIQWYPGWFVNRYAEHKDMSWFVFWIVNWGVTLPLSIIGWLRSQKRIQYITAPFLFIFVLLNLFLFQPYVWDNTKLLVWASLGISGLAGQVIYALLMKKQRSIKVLGILLFITAIFSGMLDAYGAVDKNKHNWSMYGKDDLVMVEYLRKYTPRDAIFLTSDSHNNPVMNLSGRQVVMGFRGWLWTYGFDYYPIEQDVMTMFKGSIETEALLKQYHVSYVVFDDKVRGEYGGNEEYYEKRYKKIIESNRYSIYKIE
ncbi:MAG: hypothetical protein HZA34_02480 [Candidatus Pacebacteria bacterium]|nr:hypothetical protein [Candidatus Paceibacterota bacterium]